MNILKFIVLAFFAFVSGNAGAADITLYYSPRCPHCHHARDFIENTLIYEYNDLKVLTVNVLDADNRPDFMDALKKCGYERGGVPVLVIGDKCFQGYSDSMQDDLRTAIEVDLTGEQKQAATQNKADMISDKDAFVAAHKDRINAVTEKEVKKKINNNKIDTVNIALFGLLGILFIGLLVVLFKKNK